MKGSPAAGNFVSTGENAFQALFLTYYVMMRELSLNGIALSWPLAPKGRLGFPIPIISVHLLGKFWKKTINEVIYSSVQKLTIKG